MNLDLSSGDGILQELSLLKIEYLFFATMSYIKSLINFGIYKNIIVVFRYGSFDSILIAASDLQYLLLFSL